MADEKSQVEEETSWWGFDDFADSELPSMSFDEPLEWPDSLPWEEFSAGAAPADPLPDAPLAPADLVFPIDAGPAAPVPPAAEPEPDRQWQAGGYDPDATVAAAPLSALGGDPGAPPAPHGSTAVEPLPESIWSFDDGPSRDDQLAGLAGLTAPLVYADADGKGRGKWTRRFDISRGNVAVVALISAVSLVLLGMFLSVRSRNDVPTDTRQTQTTSDQIAVGNPRNTVVITTTVPASTSVPAPAINIADLVPPTEPPADTGAAGGTGTPGRTPVATTAPARSTAAPTGGSGSGGGGSGGSTATTQPAPQSSATPPPAEQPPPSVTTTPTSPPPVVDDTTATTRRTTPPPPSFTVPSIPTNTTPTNNDPPFSIPTVTFPTRN